MVINYKINPNGKASVQKNKKSSHEDNVVKEFLKCKLHKNCQVNGVQNHFNLNQILTFFKLYLLEHCILKNTLIIVIKLYSLYRSQRFSNHLFHAVHTHRALFEKLNTLCSTKNSKNTYHLAGCSVLNALNIGIIRRKNSKLCPFYWIFLPFIGYAVQINLLSRISPRCYIYECF